eukprot:CAMPEP_0197662132 /NCGR_PEP_ID=MMETSP1338-20131121/52234_1 /TAXON_ID=43686 ORGANISM="Pelagodinium beii, Strain RCC1491" /NCGR_SAMPLE_ID=MMETSP1338 /ASSEMBLY_ACC=CAM_ASM_000754 /LENGTH=188 /DNA_ID=CAMNT_0043239851 /DNA_START=57 /DNA_END=623 /DNA_ORIENTATION=+
MGCLPDMRTTRELRANEIANEEFHATYVPAKWCFCCSCTHIGSHSFDLECKIDDASNMMVAMIQEMMAVPMPEWTEKVPLDIGLSGLVQVVKEHTKEKLVLHVWTRRGWLDVNTYTFAARGSNATTVKAYGYSTGYMPLECKNAICINTCCCWCNFGGANKPRMKLMEEKMKEFVKKGGIAAPAQDEM